MDWGALSRAERDAAYNNTAAVADSVVSVTMRVVRRRSCMSRKRSRWFAVGHSHDEPDFTSQESTANRAT